MSQIYGRIFWLKQAAAKNKPPQRPASPSPPLPLERYAGVYSNPVYGQVTISAEKGKLSMLLGVNQQKVLLQPFDRDSFTFTWPLDLETAVFAIGPDDGAMSLSVDWDGGNEFKRLKKKPGS